MTKNLTEKHPSLEPFFPFEPMHALISDLLASFADEVDIEASTTSLCSGYVIYDAFEDLHASNALGWLESAARTHKADLDWHLNRDHSHLEFSLALPPDAFPTVQELISG